MSSQRFTIRGIDDFERALELICYASDDSVMIPTCRDDPVQCFSFHLSICDCLCKAN